MTHTWFAVAFAGTVLLASAAGIPTAEAYGEDAPKAVAPRTIPYKEEPRFADQLVRIGLAFAAVMVVGAIGIGGYRRLTGARPVAKGRRLTVVETLRLSPRTTLYLLQLDRRILLIGQHGDRLSLLADEEQSRSSATTGGERVEDESPR